MTTNEGSPETTEKPGLADERVFRMGKNACAKAFYDAADGSVSVDCGYLGVCPFSAESGIVDGYSDSDSCLSEVYGFETEVPRPSIRPSQST